VGLLSYLKGNIKVNSGKERSWDLSVSGVTPLTYLGTSLDCTLENFVPHLQILFFVFVCLLVKYLCMFGVCLVKDH
jgi:hypothetical protein